ncbi:Tenascin,Angiopoietin-4,Angiopoietin-1,FibrinogenC domain-containing protein 1-A,Techylectin-5B,Angiopoietin-2,Microfibril-associated glycoprotein 4,Techylectin-5A,Ficolin-2,Tenascin-R,Ficolin-3,Ficolin-1,Fibrinogen C domain-containing protein 1-B,Fibrinogen C domain-containing protein 1 [Mytilus coruscus]|uniref:Fibrinogen C-terminal domain-containing protein n=1 Tax=Mytilus coruscus TaxID=42192 RepID=A0A6J8CKQ1_MYTCO|nr:Tenascin,Angiopoietin-4,Angiopoietin-1,FibrinogenC domain-containing protein 1-A,Techylectin-5B,Angiopoietin-2,Microfibril-associated glycoprotein 4,Techylectin-5A,Ficolin-2,Tenascin-R,Ficolin-3,Ficolin-1,Fibrinogen C domain-containing protein 1-B,Fibrinogen C domain-containing protein 1 [Mytilus coruscus]
MPKSYALEKSDENQNQAESDSYEALEMQGNDYIHALTSQGRYELRIDLHDFDNNNVYAKYQHFYVGGESSNYKLNVYGYSGPAGDSLNYHNGLPFSTFDKDNDKSLVNCAELVNGAWWFNECLRSNLNGHYFTKTPPEVWRGISWGDWKGRNYSLSATEMMIRRL